MSFPRTFVTRVSLWEDGLTAPPPRRGGARVPLHPNATTPPYTRRLIVDRVLRLGWAPADAAASAGVSVRTVWRWIARYRAEGEAGLMDRRCAPRRRPRRTAAWRVRRIEQLRRRRLTAGAIARRLGMARSTVSAVLRRLGLGRLSRLAPRPPVRRYERERPGTRRRGGAGCARRTSRRVGARRAHVLEHLEQERVAPRATFKPLWERSQIHVSVADQRHVRKPCSGDGARSDIQQIRTDIN